MELVVLGQLKKHPLSTTALNERLIGFLRYYAPGTQSAQGGGNGQSEPTSQDFLGAFLAGLQQRGLIALTAGTPGQASDAVYEITPDGEKRFAAVMQDTGIDFSLKMSYFVVISPAERSAILRKQRQARETEVAARIQEATSPLDPYRTALIQQARKHAELDIAWLDELLAAEQVAITS
jgi:DNA-binding PadR family transcriptional regulator